jgi:cytochrome c-type biogenesis protein CcmH/NrfF
VFALLGGLASQARADAPNDNANAAAEHVPAGMGMGKAGGGYAAMNRPANDTEARAMKEVMCPCGCARQSIHDCDCATAAQLRAKVQGLLAGTDLSNEASRTKAYEAVLAAFTADYGQKVLLTPKSDVSWLFPSLAAVGALGLLGFAGRRWIARGKHTAAHPVAMTAAATALDDDYSDKLDDELAETD